MITGTPGVGKTSTSKSLATELDATLVSLGELVEKEKLYTSVDKKRGSLVVDVKKISDMVQRIISNSERDVIIEGHFVVNVKPKKAVRLVFVLRRDPEELKVVLEKRGFRNKKISENLAAEILDVCLWEAVSLYGSEKTCEIDITGRSVEEVVRDMILTLKNEKESRVGVVDWLGKMEAEGKLDEYLKKF